MNSATDLIGALPLPLRDRLTLESQILEDIDKRREATGDPNIGASVERVIVDRSLREIERASLAIPQMPIGCDRNPEMRLHFQAMLLSWIERQREATGDVNLCEAQVRWVLQEDADRLTFLLGLEDE